MKIPFYPLSLGCQESARIITIPVTIEGKGDLEFGMKTNVGVHRIGRTREEIGTLKNLTIHTSLE